MVNRMRQHFGLCRLGVLTLLNFRICSKRNFMQMGNRSLRWSETSLSITTKMVKSRRWDPLSITLWKAGGYFTGRPDNYGKLPVSKTIKNMDPGYAMTKMIKLNTRKNLRITGLSKRRTQRNVNTDYKVLQHLVLSGLRVSGSFVWVSTNSGSENLTRC
jgi:hypothetical protein